MDSNGEVLAWHGVSDVGSGLLAALLIHRGQIEKGD